MGYDLNKYDTIKNHQKQLGYGENPPEKPHHAASSCPPRPKVCDWSSFSSPGPNPHVLEGALVGGIIQCMILALISLKLGPDNAEDKWNDDRADYVTNEVSLDYNAGYSSLIAGVIETMLNL